MLWLVWHMWVLLLLAFAGGVIAGWILRARSDEAPEPAAIAAPAAAPEPEAAPPSPHVPAPTADGGEAAAENSPRVAAAFSAPEPSVSRDPEPAPADSPDKDAASDDLTAIKGLGPKAAEKLAAAGVTQFSQIAGWKAADIKKYDEVLNARGRIARDDWVGQAKALSKS
jgi:predicted flap endonuclease-1-like 5' DNA nuclease